MSSSSPERASGPGSRTLPSTRATQASALQSPADARPPLVITHPAREAFPGEELQGTALIRCCQCGGSGVLRVSGHSFRTCLNCLGQGRLMARRPPTQLKGLPPLPGTCDLSAA